MPNQIIERLDVAHLHAIIAQTEHIEPKKSDVVIYQPPGHPKQARFDNEIWPPIFKPEYVRCVLACGRPPTVYGSVTVAVPFQQRQELPTESYGRLRLYVS